MAANLITKLLGSNELRIQNLTTGSTVISNLKARVVSIKFVSEPMVHQKEDGTTLIDTRVITPARVMIDGIAPSINDVSAINEVLLDRESLYQISSRGIIIANLMSDSENFRQSKDNISSTPTRISFQQVLIERVSPVVYANQSDSSLIDRGLAIIDNAEENVIDVYNKVTRFFS